MHINSVYQYGHTRKDFVRNINFSGFMDSDAFDFSHTSYIKLISKNILTEPLNTGRLFFDKGKNKELFITSLTCCWLIWQDHRRFDSVRSAFHIWQSGMSKSQIHPLYSIYIPASYKTKWRVSAPFEKLGEKVINIIKGCSSN